MAKGALQLSLSSLILFPWVFCVQMCESHHLDASYAFSLVLFSACFALVWSVCFYIIIAIIILIDLLVFF